MLNYDPKKDQINPKRCQICVQRLEEKKSDVIFPNHIILQWISINLLTIKVQFFARYMCVLKIILQSNNYEKFGSV